MTPIPTERLEEMIAAMSAPNVGMVVLQGNDLKDVLAVLLSSRRADTVEAAEVVKPPLSWRLIHEAQCFETDGGSDPEADAGTARLLREAADLIATLSSQVEGLKVALLQAREDIDNISTAGNVGCDSAFDRIDAALAAIPAAPEVNK